MKINELIHKYTGLLFQIDSSVVLLNGRRGKRGSIEVGHNNLAVLLVEVAESFTLENEIRDLVGLAKYERVIVYTSHLLPEQRKKLRDYKVGYIDEQGHYYIPLELLSDDSHVFKQIVRPGRSSSALNEFTIGYLFFCNYGLLDLPQHKIGKLIGKSAATVNIALKSMMKEKLIVLTEIGYHLANLEEYFQRWCFLLSQYQMKRERGRFTSRLSDAELSQLLLTEFSSENWAASGPKVETILSDGYLDNADELSIFVDIESKGKIKRKLKLIPDSNGEVVLYRTFLNLRWRQQFAHDVLIAAELINSNHPRIKEAGRERLAKYMREAKKVLNERFGNRSL